MQDSEKAAKELLDLLGAGELDIYVDDIPTRLVDADTDARCALNPEAIARIRQIIDKHMC